jgi:hypothetical protein
MSRLRILGKPGVAQPDNGGDDRVAAKPEELVSFACMTSSAVIIRRCPRVQGYRAQARSAAMTADLYATATGLIEAFGGCVCVRCAGRGRG